MKRIGVTGASGFVGRAVVSALAQRGDFVRAFVRSQPKRAFTSGVEVRQMDLASAAVADIAQAVAGLDAIVHLAGESVSGRWTHSKKRAIEESRELTTRNIVAAMWECQQRPGILVCASASGYYGSRRDEPLTEDAKPGDDFLAHVCIDWEREAQVAEEFGTRVVRLRQGIVLGRDGGALAAMFGPFRWGAGGPLGSGTQWWPWIHIDDDVSLYVLALDREDLRGPVNAVAPDPATNARFARALAYALRRPAVLPAPAPVLHLALGEFAESLLSSQLVLPAVAEDSGFVWKFDSLERALLDLVGSDGSRQPGFGNLQSSVDAPVSVKQAFAFASDVGRLPELTPKKFALKVLTPQPVDLQRGSTVEYLFRVRGFPVHWKSLVTRWDPPRGFEDVQVRGPFGFWKNRHVIVPKNGGVRIDDTVEYALPLQPLSDLIAPLAQADLHEIFAYRREQTKNLLC